MFERNPRYDAPWRRQRDRTDSVEEWLATLQGLGNSGPEAERAAQAAHEAQTKGMTRAQAADVALAILQGKPDVRIGLPVWDRIAGDYAFAAVVVGLALLPLSLLGNHFLFAVFALLGACLALRGIRPRTWLALLGLTINLLIVVQQLTPRIAP